MASPISFHSEFQLHGIQPNQFILLGPAPGNKGILHTVFLSKPVVGVQLKTQCIVTLNGFCRYCFIQDPGGICGFVLLTPTNNTVVKGVCVVVGSESEHYKTLFHLQPQGVLIMESSDRSTLFVANNVDSSLLVKV